jgi:hypothetical protein
LFLVLLGKHLAEAKAVLHLRQFRQDLAGREVAAVARRRGFPVVRLIKAAVAAVLVQLLVALTNFWLRVPVEVLLPKVGREALVFFIREQRVRQDQVEKAAAGALQVLLL